MNEVCKWLSMVYSEDVHTILKILKDLQTCGLVERWQDLASTIGMHELYYEFVKSEVTKEDNFDKQNYLYHEDGLRVPALMRKRPRQKDAYWPLRRIHTYNGGFTELSSREFKYMGNVEVLKLDFCFELESLDLRCLKSLQNVELRDCFQLHMVEGLEDLQELKFFRWNTCRKSILVVDFPLALEVLEVYGSKESEVSDFGSFTECIGMLELTLSHHPLLAAVSDVSKLNMLEKVDFSGCCSVEEVRGLEGLSPLRHLNLQNCKKVRHCDGLEKLAEIETLNLEGCKNVHVVEVLDLTRLVKLRSINISRNLVVQRLDLGSTQVEELEVMGCSRLRTVALPSYSGSWKFLNNLNEQRRREAVESRHWTVDCGISVVGRNSFDAYETFNLSNCHRLESLGGLGLLRSLKYLYLQNCTRLKTLPNLSNSPYLRVVDLSYCCVLEELGDIGPLRALEYLYLQNCRLLFRLRDLFAPCLKVLDLSGCSKLKYLGKFDSMRSLLMLNLNECVSLTTVPDLSPSPLLEVLNVKGCVKLNALSQMTTDNVVIDVSRCWNLSKIPILNALASLELDVSIVDDERGAVRNPRGLLLQLLNILNSARPRGLSQMTRDNVVIYIDVSECLSPEKILNELARLESGVITDDELGVVGKWPYEAALQRLKLTCEDELARFRSSPIINAERGVVGIREYRAALHGLKLTCEDELARRESDVIIDDELGAGGKWEYEAALQRLKLTCEDDLARFYSSLNSNDERGVVGKWPYEAALQRLKLTCEDELARFRSSPIINAERGVVRIWEYRAALHGLKLACEDELARRESGVIIDDELGAVWNVVYEGASL